METEVKIIQKEIKISTQAEAIRYFIEKIDIEMVDAFLDNDKTYQDYEKYLFISKLQQAFETFINHGDTYLIPIEGRCNSCFKKKTGFTFVGNNSKNYMSIIFDVKNNKIDDLFECADFKNKKTKLNLKKRIYIDKDSALPF